LATIALDTNILLYGENLRIVDADDRKIALAVQLLDRLHEGGDDVCLPMQVTGELHNGLRRKLKLAPAEANQRVLRWMQAFRPIATSEAVMRTAFALAEQHNLQTYDAIILAAAASAGCELLYSEDMQDGFLWGGVMVANPFL